MVEPDLVDFGELDPGVGSHPVGGDLPQQDPEGPNIWLGSEPKRKIIVISSVPDPKLIISNPDPQIENQAFRIRIRILDPDPSVN